RGTAVPVLLLLLLGTAPARAQPSCPHFPELLPAKLKELRVKFEEIKDYFQSKDEDLSIQLLSSDLLEEIKGSLGCQSVSEMMGFYMEEVLPSAIRTSTQHQHSMGDLGNLLLSLKATMRRCVRFVHHIPVTATLNSPGFPLQMNKNGIYKAMGEFDIFINYIEKYLTMRRRN
ncbi:IL10 protein, partial [Chloropsis hardwickii]|nr:IL10 protein [Chloropsis hardwickii]